ncbi:MAG: sensor histidine kinase [Thermoleophilia bacterium]
MQYWNAIGKQGSRTHYRQIQRWVIIWRLLTLLIIPAEAFASPEKLGSLRHAFVIFSIAFVYSLAHGTLVIRQRVEGVWLHIMDLAFCSGFMMLSGEPRMVFLMSAFSFSCYLANLTPYLRVALPSAFILSFSYIAANETAGIPPWQTLTRPHELGVVVLYYFFAFGFTGFAIILDRLSSLELDNLLEYQLRSYRRRLHDDVGNTLCGLHFKIQTLKHLKREGINLALDYLVHGYRQASRALRDILAGLDDAVEGEIDDMIRRIRNELEQSMGVQIDLAGLAAGARLSPEVMREVSGIIRETAVNACKHAGVEHMTISVLKRRGRLSFTIEDEGHGFDEELLSKRQQEGHMGIRGMHERAALIDGRLETFSAPGEGTRVVLQVKTQAGGRFNWFLEQDTRQTGKLYSLLVLFRIPILVLEFVQIRLLPEELRYSYLTLFVAVSLTVNCLFWVLFRPMLYRKLRRCPWLISLDFAYLSVFYLIAQSQGYPLFYFVYIYSAFMLSGLLLGARGNLQLAASFNLVAVASYLLAPADISVVTALQQREDFVSLTIGVFIIAFSCGLAGDFIRRLEEEQELAISRSLARQQEQLTKSTHHELQSLVAWIIEEVEELIAASPLARGESDRIRRVEELSRDLKARMRKTMRALEDTADMDGKAGGFL